MRFGFIVEGDTDKAIAETLIRRMLPSSIQLHTVRLGGKIALPSAYTTVALFLDRGHEHVFILFDTDSTIASVIARQRREVEAPLREHHLLDRAAVCPVVPTIEAWLLAGMADQPDSVPDPKAELTRTLRIRPSDVGALARLATTIDLDLARRRNASFAEFTDAVLAAVHSEAEV